MQKQLSLIKLKAIRDAINQGLPESINVKAFIIEHGHDTQTRKPVSVVSRLPLLNTPHEANWSYHLVLGKFTENE